MNGVEFGFNSLNPQKIDEYDISME